MQRRSASLRTAWKSPQQSSRSGRTLCRCCSSSSVSYILSKAPWQQPATATFIAAAPPLRRRRARLQRHRPPPGRPRAGGAGLGPHGRPPSLGGRYAPARLAGRRRPGAHLTQRPRPSVAGPAEAAPRSPAVSSARGGGGCRAPHLSPQHPWG